MIVTAGATIEAIDPVRFISNHSSGKMGYAIAGELAARGAEVTLITGRTALSTPRGVRRVDVLSAAEMYAEAVGLCGGRRRGDVPPWRTTRPRRLHRPRSGNTTAR